MQKKICIFLFSYNMHIIIFLNFYIMVADKPRWWVIWYTPKQAEDLARQEAQKRQQDMLKRNIQGRVWMILEKSKK